MKLWEVCCNWMKDYSIRGQLILGIALVHAILMTIFVFDLVGRQRSFLNDQTVAQTGSLANTVATNSVSWVLARDVAGLQEIMQSVAGYPGLRYAMIVAPNGRVLAHTNETYVGRYVTDKASQELLARTVPVAGRIQDIEVSQHLVDVASPVTSNGKHIAWARVAVGGEKIVASLDSITRDGISYTVVAIVVGTLFAIVLAGSIASRLKQLMKVTSGVREGKIEKRADLESGDEIGQLARDFNLMLDALDTQRTAKLNAWRELERHRDHLEDLVKDRTHELEKARDQALVATRAKSEFLANMSHELRTPLNSIIGFSGLLLDGIAGPVNAEQQKQLGMVHKSAKHLLELINDILDISKIEAGKIQLNNAAFSVKELMTEMVDLMAPQAAAKNLQLELDSCGACDRCTLFTDRARLKQVIINLLGNAIKFTETGVVRLRKVCDTEDGFRIDVEDTGIGLRPQDIDSVFEAFHQVDGSSTREFEGTGLGLAISKKIMSLIGGRISVASTYGQGSTFSVHLQNAVRTIPATESLPTVWPAEVKGEPRRGRTKSDNKPLVLVVDDDPHALELMRKYLEGTGFAVMTRSHGENIVDIARETRPFAITLDIIMPTPDGWTVLAALKNDPEVSEIPVIIVSTLDEQNLGLSLGAVDYLQKPIDQDKLMYSLERLAQAGSHVMIIDDSFNDAELVRSMIDPAGYTTIWASSGEAALGQIANYPPGVIILDLMMPGMSGFEVIRRLRSAAATKDIPVIVSSAKTLSDAESAYLSENVQQILQKGQFDQKTMLGEVASALARIQGDLSGTDAAEAGNNGVVSAGMAAD